MDITLVTAAGPMHRQRWGADDNQVETICPHDCEQTDPNGEKIFESSSYQLVDYWQNSPQEGR